MIQEKKKKQELTFTDIVSRYSYINGRKFNFKNRPHLIAQYNTDHNFILLKSSRKTEKSTFLCNKIMFNSCIFKNFSSMYVAPRQSQVRDFSNAKFRMLQNQSPYLRGMTDQSCIDNVSFKTFTTHSMVYFTACWLSPDALRGPACEALFIDEIQDILYDNIPVALEVLSGEPPDDPGRPKKLKIFSGTPKSFDNTIEHYWKVSTQNEWMVPCPACHNWNLPDIPNIGKEGLICSRCKKPIDPRTGRWVSFNPEANILGFHPNQLMLHWTDWKELLVKLETYSEAKFKNEVLGNSHDSGEKPVSLKEIEACCGILGDKGMITSRTREVGAAPLFMGIDWGTSQEGASFTVAVIGGYIRPGILSILWAKRYTEKENSDPEGLIRDMAHYAHAFNVSLIAPDWGFGFFINRQLRQKVSMQVAEVYAHGTIKEKLKYDKVKDIFIMNRNETYADVLMNIKNMKMSFPRWSEWKTPFAEDIYNIHQTTNKRGDAYFDRNPSKAIDTLSAITNLFVATKIFYGIDLSRS